MGSACGEKYASEPNPKPRLKRDPSSADVAERGLASIGVRSSGNRHGIRAAWLAANGLSLAATAPHKYS